MPTLSMVSMLLLSVTTLWPFPSHAFVDFGHLTRVTMTPTPAGDSIPRPHQLPLDFQWPPQMILPSDKRERQQQKHPMITAVAPFLAFDRPNGSHHIVWSTTYHRYLRHFQNARGLFKRQDGGVFGGTLASLLATCTPCASGGQAMNTRTNASLCYPATASLGVLSGVAPTGSGGGGSNYYGSNYSGVLIPSATTSDLPCCPSCTPITTNGTGTVSITTGVLGPINSTTSALSTTGTSTVTTITVVTSTTIVVSSGTVVSTITMVNQTSGSTSSPVTISIDTITPTNSTGQGSISPTVTTLPDTVIGCGTASGSGTVVGSGTVYLGPRGIFPVTSSGTVSGFASKVIGCGTIIATLGGFSGTGTVIGCGTGTGCAALTGIGTVYPDALGGLVGITSSGTVSGCGKVVGCGTLVGTGSFAVSMPYTKTISSPPSQSTTVNVYISYCPSPPDDANMFRIGANLTDLSPSSASVAARKGAWNNGTQLAPLPPYPLSPANSTNSTSASPSFANPLCQLCPNDSGICCPLSASCGGDGHCPYTALRGAGYLRFGVNVVDMANSSANIGMSPSNSTVQDWVEPDNKGEENRRRAVGRMGQTAAKGHVHNRLGRLDRP